MTNFVHEPMKIFVLFVFVLFLTPFPASAQEEQPEEEEFVDWGYISVSRNFTLGEKNRFIVFPIKNNTTRSIHTIHAWIYELLEDDKGGSTYRLVNNPNIGGLLFKTKLHIPGKVADWRFSLVAANQQAGGEPKFNFRVSHRGIFFAKTEPPASSKSAQ